MLELNKIYNMDCLEGMKQLEDNSIDLIVTDPPYGIGINKMNFVTSGSVKSGLAKRNDFSNHNTEWDNLSLTKKQLKEIQRISKNRVIFGANNFSEILPNSRCWLVWDKREQDKYSNDFADCEFAWTSFDKPSRIIRYLWSGMIQSEMGLYKEKRYHPTQKPIFVIKKILEMFSEESYLVCDPFMGSGTTAVACKQLGRKFIGFELSKEYCDIANKRLQQNTLLSVCPDKRISGKRLAGEEK